MHSQAVLVTFFPQLGPTSFPEFPQIVPQAGIQSLSTWAHEIISYSDHPEVLVVKVRMANNINLSGRKLAFRADFSSY